MDTHYNQTVQCQNQGENIESSKRESTHHIQVILDKILDRFVIRNFEVQKAVG